MSLWHCYDTEFAVWVVTGGHVCSTETNATSVKSANKTEGDDHSIILPLAVPKRTQL